MIDNPVFPNAANWNIASGMTVYSTGGEHIGTVRSYSPITGCLDVQEGRSFQRDLYIPLSQVGEVTPDGVQLRMAKAELEADCYSRPPIRTATKLDPVLLVDGSIGIEPMRVCKEPLNYDDMTYLEGSTDKERDNWAIRPR